MPKALFSALAAGLLLASPALAEEQPLGVRISGWLGKHGFQVKERKACPEVERKEFGAKALGPCVDAKAKRETKKGSNLFPRLTVTVAEYGDEAAAAARMARFQEVPPALGGEAGKVYPLRAGFRKGSQVVVVTTDAFAFEQDAQKAAAGLHAAFAGTDLSCFGKCPSFQAR